MASPVQSSDDVVQHIGSNLVRAKNRVLMNMVPTLCKG